MKRTLLSQTRGSTTALVAAAMPMLIALVALAVDVGMVHLESRRIQGDADQAALAAASDLSRADTLARSMMRGPVIADVRPGRYTPDPALEPHLRFKPQPGGDAVRVTLQRDVPTAFARIFGTDSVRVERSATAARADMAAFSLGSRLASLDGGILNAALSSLTGSNVRLSVMDYNALAGAEIDLAGYLDALRTRARLSAVTYDDVLTTDISGSLLMQAVGDNVADPVARAALVALASAAQGSARLDRLFDLGALGGQASGGNGLVRTNALDLVTNLLQTSNGGNRIFSTDIGAGVSGLGSTRATVALGERPVGSPWIAITRTGEPVVRTAQARILIETQLAPALLPGLSLASIELPLLVELASAEARLDALSCAAPRSARIAARPAPGLIAIAKVDRARLDDFSRPLTRSRARLLRTLLVEVEGEAAVDLGSAEPWQPLVFTDIGTMRKIKSSRLVGGVASSLVRDIRLNARLVGFLPLPLDPVTQAVGSQLSLVAPVLDGLISTLTGTLGIGIGEAEVTLTGLRCGQPVLVA